MATPTPLPFRFKVGEETIWGVAEFKEVKSHLEGLMHLEDDMLILEWTQVDKIDEVGLTGGSEEKRVSDLEGWEIPVEWLVDARHVGGWIIPAVELRARALHVFEGIPGADGAKVRLRYARRDGAIAREMVAAINRVVRGES